MSLPTRQVSSIKLPKTKSTADLINDMENGGPIVAQLLPALRDPKDLTTASDSVIENSEYDVVESELPDLRKKIQCGPRV